MRTREASGMRSPFPTTLHTLCTHPYTLCTLCSDMRIRETFGMRSLFPNERATMLKAGPFIDVLREEQ